MAGNQHAEKLERSLSQMSKSGNFALQKVKFAGYESTQGHFKKKLGWLQGKKEECLFKHPSGWILEMLIVWLFVLNHFNGWKRYF